MTTDPVTVPSDRSIRDRVLVVDDEPLIRGSLSETLGKLGYFVAEAGDARGAIAAAGPGQSPFGVVVLDVRLPDANGLDLLATLRRLVPDARIILMTTHGSSEWVRRALDLGAYCVLHKPFRMSTVAQIVDEASDDALVQSIRRRSSSPRAALST